MYVSRIRASARLLMCPYLEILDGYRVYERLYVPRVVTINGKCFPQKLNHTNTELRRWIQVVIAQGEAPVAAGSHSVEMSLPQFQRLIDLLLLEHAA